MDVNAPAEHPHRAHWHWLYQHRRRSLAKTTNEIFYSQLVAVVGAMFAGLLLDITKDELALVAGVLMILPGVFDLGGSVAGALAAKIHHRLELGAHGTRRIYIGSVVHGLLLIGVAAGFLGLFAGGLAYWVLQASPLLVFGITVMASLMSATIGLPIVGALTLLAWRRGLNPDNVIGPLEAALFDALSVGTVFIAVQVLA